MNIALEKCEEHVNGVKKRSYGDAFVRGNNGECGARVFCLRTFAKCMPSDVYLGRCVKKNGETLRIAFSAYIVTAFKIWTSPND
jgi:hypothetical protein